MKTKEYKMCFISSHGGHLRELYGAVNGIEGKSYWVTYKTKHTRKLMQDKPHYFVINPHLNKFLFLLNGFQSLFHLFIERPKVIISTGAGIAIPSLLIGKFLFKSKIIFVESAAVVDKPSKSGKFMYRYSDLFLLQWKCQKNFYPNGKYVGIL